MTQPGIHGRMQDPTGFEPRQVLTRVALELRLNDIRRGRSGLQNSYWRFGMRGKHTRDDVKEFLQRRGFYYKDSEKLARLEALAERCDRGHPSYEKYYVAQLRQFVKNRELKKKLPSKANKKQLVQHLEDADVIKDAVEDSREFPRFHELPPELRNAVYTFYFKALKVVPQRFSQPPLCTVSRVLRAESLTLFFEHSTFSLSMTRPLLKIGDAIINKQSKLLRDSILLSDFVRIKHLRVALEVGTYLSVVGTWTIDLTTGKSTADVSRGQQQEMQRVVDGIMARGGVNKLRKRDLEDFRSAWSRGCLNCGSRRRCWCRPS
jgi:hypothetical protein